MTAATVHVPSKTAGSAKELRLLLVEPQLVVTAIALTMKPLLPAKQTALAVQIMFVAAAKIGDLAPTIALQLVPMAGLMAKKLATLAIAFLATVAIQIAKSKKDGNAPKAAARSFVATESVSPDLKILIFAKSIAQSAATPSSV